MPGQEAALRQVSLPRQRAKATACTAVPGQANALLTLGAESPALKGQRRREMEVALFSF